MDREHYGKLATIDEIRWAQYDDFRFDFIKENDGTTEVVPKDSFVKGNTISGKNVMFHIQNPFTLHKGISHFNTSLYMMGESPENGRCSGMLFRGGILKRLFIPNRIVIDYQNNEYKVCYNNDTIEYSFVSKGKNIKLGIESAVHEKQGVNGKSLENTEVNLMVSSEDGFSLGEIVPLYNTIERMCQFLSFRKNIEFEHVALLENKLYGKCRVSVELMDVFIKNDYESITKKDWIRCISFENLGENVVNLFKAIYEEKEKSPYFSLDFLPESDSDAKWITSAKIKSICTCLECEAALHGIKAENNEQFVSLVDEIKRIIHEHEKNSDALPEKTYDVIRGSINNWDYSASDKVKELFHRYEEILIQPGCFAFSSAKFENGIDAIIKYRNTTTHGNYMSISEDMANIAANLMNLIYISRLDRIGMSREMIKEKICNGVVYR